MVGSSKRWQPDRHTIVNSLIQAKKTKGPTISGIYLSLMCMNLHQIHLLLLPAMVEIRMQLFPYQKTHTKFEFKPFTAEIFAPISTPTFGSMQTPRMTGLATECITFYISGGMAVTAYDGGADCRVTPTYSMK